MNADSLKVEFVGIRIEVPSNVPMLLFKETGTSNYLPISIGMPEATSIMSVLQNQQLPRPLTHDLFNDFFDAAGFEIMQLHISHVTAGTFFAEILIKEISSGKTFQLSCRPSDGVALAIRSDVEVEVTVSRDLFDELSIELDADNAEDEIEQFKSFLDEISPDDFT